MRGRGSFKRWRKISIIKSKPDLMSLRLTNFLYIIFMDWLCSDKGKKKKLLDILIICLKNWLFMFLSRASHLNLDITSFIAQKCFEMFHLCIICRIGVEKGRKLFKSLLMRCSKNKKEWSDAQARVEDLKQQLEEAEGLVVRKKDQFDMSRKQVRLSIGHLQVKALASN